MAILETTQSAATQVLGSRSRLELIRCLYAARDGLSGREIARRAGFSHQQIHNELKGLVVLGLVERQVVAPAYLFRLNRDHWVVRDVLRIVFDRERRWLDGLLAGLRRGLPRCVVSLVLYGSAADGRLREHSDFDVLALVRGDGEKRGVVSHFADQSSDVLKRYQHALAPLVMTVEQFRRSYRRREGFARNVLRTGRVVSGRSLTEIL